MTPTFQTVADVSEPEDFIRVGVETVEPSGVLAVAVTACEDADVACIHLSADDAIKLAAMLIYWAREIRRQSCVCWHADADGNPRDCLKCAP